MQTNQVLETSVGRLTRLRQLINEVIIVILSSTYICCFASDLNNAASLYEMQSSSGCHLYFKDVQKNVDSSMTSVLCIFFLIRNYIGVPGRYYYMYKMYMYKIVWCSTNQNMTVYKYILGCSSQFIEHSAPPSTDLNNSTHFRRHSVTNLISNTS